VGQNVILDGPTNGLSKFVLKKLPVLTEAVNSVKGETIFGNDILFNYTL